jgi:hypothetical protein
MVGDHFLVRGYENGKHFMTREKFNPTLFVPSNKKTKYQTLSGEYVEPIKPGSVRDCREFIKKYDGVENFKIHGNTGYIYLKSMGTQDTSTNTSLRCIRKMKSSLIRPKLRLQQLTLRLHPRMDSLM